MNTFLKKILVCAGFFLLFTSLQLGAIPKAEYPRPQFERDTWINLNGEWTYEFDLINTGLNKGLYQTEGFGSKIIVPYAPESKLSGVAHTDFLPAIWYHRTIQIPSNWGDKII